MWYFFQYPYVVTLTIPFVLSMFFVIKNYNIHPERWLDFIILTIFSFATHSWYLDGGIAHLILIPLYGIHALGSTTRQCKANIPFEMSLIYLSLLIMTTIAVMIGNATEIVDYPYTLIGSHGVYDSLILSPICIGILMLFFRPQ